MTNDAKYWIDKLRLEPHPEGGYFRQTYKSEVRIVPEDSHPFDALRSLRAGSVAKGATRMEQPSTKMRESQSGGTRAASTAIYFLLVEEDFSALHRLRSDEMWHFYAGSPLAVHVIAPEGEYSSIRLGNNPERGEVFQAVVQAGCWFGAEVARDFHVSQDRRDVGQPMFALVGCTVAPGFEFEGFELARREELSAKYPHHRELIERLTRE
ncbi:MAG TPA: cupin domain-containing protein [Verrucomicrobiae bacterium]|nr:cupin domain-containing protein [Verrucomicrobiae bacterium]